MACSQQGSPPPMDGIRVLDLTQIYNGPYATFLMARAGADVVKVEPPGGEYLRRRDARSGAQVPFAMLNANKRSIALDLKDADDHARFLALAAVADVVIENFAPGVMARLGLDYATLAAANPRLVYASGSGYGGSGPYRDFPAMDLTVQAMAGVMSATGFADQPPVKSGAALCDFFGGVHLFGAVTMALLRRERSGRGGQVEVAMMDAVYPALASGIGMLHGERRDIPPRTGNRHGGLSLCPYNVYPAADGHLAIICNAERHWTQLLAAMGDAAPAWARDLDMAGRVARMDDIDAAIGGWTATQPRAALFERLAAHRVPTAPVRDLAEVMHDPHLRARGMVFDIHHPEQGDVTLCDSPLRRVGEAAVPYRPSPAYGAHGADVAAQWLAARGEAS